MYLHECYYSKEQTRKELKNKRNTKGRHVNIKLLYLYRLNVYRYSLK